jgi:cold-inducible RNA-binding protein
MLPEDAPSHSGQHAPAETEDYIIGTKLFVGNLNFRTTQAEVEDLFAEVGDVEEVFLPADRNTGRPRGFAFVTYADEDSAQEAIEKFDGYDLGGRPLRVNEATERPSRGPMGGGGGGGGFDDDFGGGGRPPKPQGRPKGSRRNMRAKKRSL